MKGRRHTPEQIIRKLREADRLLGEGKTIADVAKLLEVNSTRVQSDLLNRVQESRGHLEVEIRKLLHEVSRVAERALGNARKAREQGASAIETAWGRLGTLEREVVKLGDVASLPSPRQWSQ